MSPLPSVRLHGAKQCKARSKRSMERCKNPAAYGMPVCRFHGARRAVTVLRGRAHPQYRHGKETLAMKQERSSRLSELRDLETAMYELRMTTAPRTRGRKPKNQIK
jgi:hypothetical protein